MPSTVVQSTASQLDGSGNPWHLPVVWVDDALMVVAVVCVTQAPQVAGHKVWMLELLHRLTFAAHREDSFLPLHHN